MTILITKLFLCVGIPLIPAVLGVVLGVLKDGSPFHVNFWTAANPHVEGESRHL